MRPQRVGEQLGHLGRPHVLVLQVDQPPGPLDRLRVPPGDRPLAVRREPVRRPDGRVGPQVLHDVGPQAAGRGSCGGSGSAVVRPRLSRSSTRRSGCRRRGRCGSSQRSRNTVSRPRRPGRGSPAARRATAGWARRRPPSPAAAGRRGARRRPAGRGTGRSRRRRRRPASRPGRAAGRRASGGATADPAHPLVEHDHAAAVLDLPVQRPVLLLAERHPVHVRAPHQPADEHPRLTASVNSCGDRRALGPQLLVGVAAPVGEEEVVPLVERLHRLDQPVEVRRRRAPAGCRGCPPSSRAGRSPGCHAPRR